MVLKQKNKMTGKAAKSKSLRVDYIAFPVATQAVNNGR